MKSPWMGKLLALAAVLLLLMVALAQVSGIVAERSARLRQAQASLADSLAGPQTLVGPVLQRQCTETWETQQGSGPERRTVTERREFVQKSAPRSLDVTARATMQARQRGLFPVKGYAVQATLVAQWADLQALQPVREHAGSKLSCAAPVLWVALGDARGIRSARVLARGSELKVEPGSLQPKAAQGFHAGLQTLWPQADVPEAEPLQVQVTLDLLGTTDLAVAPIGDVTQVRLSADWPHPSFNGRFLPTRHAADGQGFDASWQVSALASTAPRVVLQEPALCSTCLQTLGVSFIDPVNGYVLSDRATKYGLLFIVLTFVAVALVEVLRRLRVHPVQYLLVGCALTLFFLLLVSLSEHLPFAWAYGLASAACTGLLGFYGAYLLGGWRAGAGFGAAMAGLYAVLYALLQLEQTALVLGAGLLFVVLAAVMVATRKLDWYALAASWRSEPPVAAAP